MADVPDTSQMAHLIKLMQNAHPERSADDIRTHLQAITDHKPNYPEPMVPPWDAFPKIPGWGSIGWRMGGGEDYLRDYRAWFHTLSDNVRSAYIQETPEPDTYKGMFAALLKSP